MKNKIHKIALIILLLLVIALSVTSCKLNEKINELECEIFGHSLVIATEERPATCTVAGTTAKIVCERCGYVELAPKILLPTGHRWSLIDGKPATCTEDGYSAYQLCNCGEKQGFEILPAEHSWVDVEEKPATCTENGYSAHKACDCGEKQDYESFEALGHTWGEPDENGNKVCSVCGEVESVATEEQQ